MDVLQDTNMYMGIFLLKDRYSAARDFRDA